MLDASQRHRDGNCDAESRGRGFYRPFKLLSDQDIMNFLDVNEIPSEIDDVRFLRYVNDHERLVKGLFLPFLFDQRVTLLFFGYHSMCVALAAALLPNPNPVLLLHAATPLRPFLTRSRSSVFTYITLDADIDRFVNTIDELPWPRFLFHFVVAPSFPLYDALNHYENESSVDEFLRFLFLLLSAAEACRFMACIIYIFCCRRLNSDAAFFSICWSIFKYDVFEFFGVIILSFVSHFLWDGFVSSSKLQFLFYIEMFALPIWYFRTFLRIHSFVLDVVFKFLVLWAKSSVSRPFGKHVRQIEIDHELALIPSHTVAPSSSRKPSLQLPVAPPSSLNRSLPPPDPAAQQPDNTVQPIPAGAAEASPTTPSPPSPNNGIGQFFFGRRFEMVSRPELYRVLPGDVVLKEPFEVLGEGKFGIVLKASYVNGDAVVKLSKSPESLPIHEECKCHWQLSKTTTCVADLKGFVSETHDGRKTIRELFCIVFSYTMTAVEPLFRCGFTK